MVMYILLWAFVIIMFVNYKMGDILHQYIVTYFVTHKLDVQ